MRYGKSAGVTEIDPTARRKASMSLKKAAPDVGTQYCIKCSASGLQFASLSTRNGGYQYYWKSLATLSKKVALSALETYGSVDKLLAGESSVATIGEVLPAAELEKARKVFEKLVGAEVMARFAADDDDSSSGSPDEEEEAPAAKSEEAPTKQEAPSSAAKSSRAAKSEASSSSTPAESESAMSKKRKARMELVDDLKTLDEAKKTRPASEEQVHEDAD